MAMSKDKVARILDRIALTDKGPLGTACGQLVEAIDDGVSGVMQRAEKLVADAWATGARAVATSTGSAQRKAIASLVAVSELEQKLGLAPVTEPEPAPEPAAEPEPEPSYTPTGTGW